VSPESLLCELEWDSRFFNLRIARVQGDRLSADELAEIERLRAERAFDCLYFLAAPDDPGTLARVAAAGWRFVDVRTTLRVKLDGVPAARPLDDLRPADSRDIPALRALAGASHVDSRFYQDGRFPRALCDRLFAEWIERCVEGALADNVLVAGAPGAPRGYVTVRAPREEHPADIGLFAVAPGARGQGLGGALLAGAIAWARALGEPVLEVVTQGSNARALRAYERAGFTTQQVAYWYHAWR
jgi:dTDP-4-amino-4,6-dideoxy-D-galactose acyltransferase